MKTWKEAQRQATNLLDSYLIGLQNIRKDTEVPIDLRFPFEYNHTKRHQDYETTTSDI